MTDHVTVVRYTQFGRLNIQTDTDIVYSGQRQHAFIAPGTFSDFGFVVATATAAAAAASRAIAHRVL